MRLPRDSRASAAFRGARGMDHSHPNHDTESQDHSH